MSSKPAKLLIDESCVNQNALKGNMEANITTFGEKKEWVKSRDRGRPSTTDSPNTKYTDSPSKEK